MFQARFILHQKAHFHPAEIIQAMEVHLLVEALVIAEMLTHHMPLAALQLPRHIKAPTVL
ncbi:hypothetical protein GCM10022289_18300 [Pedobacter jeongneungensis]|uniref:Uncharacterized protein n=1 Tax=Pedobacter jeongneungensis TaxID=947309 RepID=A0ABP8BBM2_9SPHI